MINRSINKHYNTNKFVFSITCSIPEVEEVIQNYLKNNNYECYGKEKSYKNGNDYFKYEINNNKLIINTLTIGNNNAQLFEHNSEKIEVLIREIRKLNGIDISKSEQYIEKQNKITEFINSDNLNLLSQELLGDLKHSQKEDLITNSNNVEAVNEFNINDRHLSNISFITAFIGLFGALFDFGIYICSFACFISIVCAISSIKKHKNNRAKDSIIIIFITFLIILLKYLN